jgi:hypothetical protein
MANSRHIAGIVFPLPRIITIGADFQRHCKRKARPLRFLGFLVDSSPSSQRHTTSNFSTITTFADMATANISAAIQQYVHISDHRGWN